MTPKRRILPVFIPHAGCEHDCVFCNQRKITGKENEMQGIDKAILSDGADEPHRRFPVDYDDVIEHLLRLKSLKLVSLPAEIAFYGGSFTALPSWRQEELLEAVQPFLERNPHNSIRLSTRPDCVDDETIARLIRYGVATVELGAQSMCDDVLIKSRRGHTAADVAHASKRLKDAGLTLILQMMTGLPGDTRHRSIDTAKRFLELAPDGVRIYPTVVVMDTQLYNMWLSGVYTAQSIDEAIELCAELIELFAEANIPVIRLGLNPSESLSAGNAVAGAYHPAFGELVYSKVYYNHAVRLLSGIKQGSNITLSVDRGCVSKMMGQHRSNISALKEEFALGSLKVTESTLLMGELIRLQEV